MPAPQVPRKRKAGAVAGLFKANAKLGPGEVVDDRPVRTGMHYTRWEDGSTSWEPVNNAGLKPLKKKQT